MANLRIATSGLDAPGQELVESLVDMCKGAASPQSVLALAGSPGPEAARLVEEWGSATHLVVGTDGENRVKRTQKYLDAIAAGVRVVGLGWAHACLAARGRADEPDHFIYFHREVPAGAHDEHLPVFEGLRNFVTGMIHSMHQSSRRRSELRPWMAWSLMDIPVYHDCRVRWLQGMINEQRGECYISRRPLSLNDMSPERLNQQIGYMRGNVVLIRHDFQTSHAQWTREIFEEVGRLRQLDAFEPRRDLWRGALGPSPRTPEQDVLLRRLKAAETSAAWHHRTKGVRRGWGPCGVDKAFLVAQYLRQGGRCYYTNVPLDVQGTFMWSMERLDPSLGYIASNVVLSLSLVNGYSQWNRAKADYYWGPLVQ